MPSSCSENTWALQDISRPGTTSLGCSLSLKFDHETCSYLASPHMTLVTKIIRSTSLYDSHVQDKFNILKFVQLLSMSSPCRSTCFVIVKDYDTAYQILDHQLKQLLYIDIRIPIIAIFSRMLTKPSHTSRRYLYVHPCWLWKPRDHCVAMAAVNVVML